jgi:two-component system sensor histidine kinase PilS (NtrC family)
VNQLVIRDLADGIVVIDDQDCIRSGNLRAELLFGSIATDGMQHLDAYSPVLSKALQRWRHDPGRAAEPIRSSRGNWLVQPRFVAIGDGQATVISLIDQSEQQKQVQQVKLAALGRLTASIAHEIRNPLSSINHAAELLQEDENQAPANTRLVTIIRDNVQRLDRMVQEVLHLNRRDEAHIEQLPGAAYLGQFANDFSQIEKVPGEMLSLEIDTAQAMFFDRIHLDQVLWNLTSNAWRHCQKRAGSIRRPWPLSRGCCSSTLAMTVRVWTSLCRTSCSSRSSRPNPKALGWDCTSRARCARQMVPASTTSMSRRAGNFDSL